MTIKAPVRFTAANICESLSVCRLLYLTSVSNVVFCFFICVFISKSIFNKSPFVGSLLVDAFESAISISVVLVNASEPSGLYPKYDVLDIFSCFFLFLFYFIVCGFYVCMYESINFLYTFSVCV